MKAHKKSRLAAPIVMTVGVLSGFGLGCGSPQHSTNPPEPDGHGHEHGDHHEEGHEHGDHDHEGHDHEGHQEGDHENPPAPKVTPPASSGNEKANPPPPPDADQETDPLVD